MTNVLIWLVLFLAIGSGVLILVFGVLLALSYLGGWGALARAYAVTPETNKGNLLEEKYSVKPGWG